MIGSSAIEQNNSVVAASYNEAAEIRRTGFIAQEVEKAANEAGYGFSGISKPQSQQEHYGLSYESFVVPLVKAVQEQQSIIQKQQITIQQQQKQFDQQQITIQQEQKQINQLLSEISSIKNLLEYKKH